MSVSPKQNGRSSTLVGICLVERRLRVVGGHEFSYPHSVYLAARRHQIQCNVLGSKDLAPEACDIMPITPAFRRAAYDCRVLPKSLAFLSMGLEGNWRFYQGLMSAGIDSLGPRWVVFDITATHAQLLAWAFWLRQLKPNQAPALVLMLRMSYYRPLLKRWRSSVIWLRPALRMLERLASGYRVYLVTDSARLVEEYHSLTRLPMTVLPIPYTDSIESYARPHSFIARPITMVSLGGYRPEKGYETLLAAIQRVYERQQMAGLDFRLQISYCTTTGQAAIPTPAFLVAFKSLGLPNVTLIEHALSNKEYVQFLSEADVVLLPFRVDEYYARTSGTFTEALATGKPVVVTQGTWMSDQLERFGAGVTFRDGDVDDLARAICEARDEHPRLAEQALARRKDWVAYHNSDNFLNELLKLDPGAV